MAFIFAKIITVLWNTKASFLRIVLKIMPDNNIYQKFTAPGMVYGLQINVKRYIVEYWNSQKRNSLKEQRKMSNFRARLARFMYGRYGIDQLYYAMTVLCAFLMIANSFLQNFILGVVIWVLLIITVFRAFSRNIYKRQRENLVFLKIWNPAKSRLKTTAMRIKEFRTKRYRTCPHCRAVLRLPRKKGRHIVECPKCHRDFPVRVLF